MKRNFTLLIIFLFFTRFILSAQNMLRIQDPDWWDFEGFQGTITEATFAIQPQGAYMDVGMFLTFSDEGLGFSNYDTLEIILDFNLPEGSIVYDSWLWMLDDTTIVRADVHDIWSATATYEDIVDRNRDPSILYRKPNGGYQIRVFPLPGGESRKVKISYLVPAVWSSEDVQAWLPTEILQTSANPLSTFKIITLPHPSWKNPRLKEVQNISFQSAFDPNYGDIMVANVPTTYLNKPLHFVVDAPFNSDGVFVQQLKDGTDNFYQVAYLPPELPVPANPKKLVFLFDHEEYNSHIDKDELYHYMKEMCYSYLRPEDQFNFIFSNQNGSLMLSNNWIPGNPNFMEQAFEQFATPIEDYTNLLDLLTDGISFVKNNGGEGDLILVVNSDNLSSWNVDNIVEDLETLIDGDAIKIHIINYQFENFYWEWIWNGPDGWNYNNKEFYHQLSTSTGGNLYGAFEGASNVWANISSLLNTLKSDDYDFDLYTSLNSGFTFNRFHQTYLGQSRNINQPILQIGKYAGVFPFQVEYSAVMDSVFVFENFEVPANEIISSDSLNREIWVGHHIRDLEGVAVGVSGIQEIIDLSIEERVLSKYTAFLALDLEQGAEPCLECWEFDDIWIVDNDEIFSNDIGINISAYPNPFSDQCSIDIELKPGFTINEASLSIFDAYGKNLLNQDLNDLTVLGNFQWTWNGRDATGQPLPSGIYYVVIKTEKGVKTVKLILMK